MKYNIAKIGLKCDAENADEYNVFSYNGHTFKLIFQITFNTHVAKTKDFIRGKIKFFFKGICKLQFEANY